jgi:hypothetical protein
VPHAIEAAVRARTRAVQIRIGEDGVKVLNEGRDAGYNPMHRPVLLLGCGVLRSYHVTNLNHRPFLYPRRLAISPTKSRSLPSMYVRNPDLKFL